MSIKREEISIDDGPESGQCSEDETERLVMERKTKKHKKRTKGNKPKKRKHSNSTSSSAKTENEFFNPYSVNIEKYSLKTECDDPLFVPEVHDEEISLKSSDVPNYKIFDETFNNLNRNNLTNSVDSHLPQIRNGNVSSNEFQQKSNRPMNSNSHPIVNNRKALYLFDETGIEKGDDDLRYFLLDVGFSNVLACDVFDVLYHSPSPEPEQVSNHEDEVDENEDEMFNDLPIIDTSVNSHDDIYANSYSPEPVNKIIEPYNSEIGRSISYAPHGDSRSYLSSLQPINEIIDPQAIPDVGPRDPRLNQNKQLLQKFNTIPKMPVPENNNIEKYPQKPVENNNPLLNKDWEIKVIGTVKTHLKLYLVHNDISKEEYKSILKRAVNKIISSGDQKLDTDKISKFLHSYVIMMQKSRFVDSI